MLRTIIQATLIVSAAIGFATRAHAAPDVCQGRFAIDGGLDLGGNASSTTRLSASRRITLDGSDGGFVVGVGDCAATVVTQAPRSDAFVLRSRFVGCGERPRFRLRLAFSADCQTVTGRVRAGGRVVDQFTAHDLGFGGRHPIPTGPTRPRPTHPTDPTTPTTPSDPGNPSDPGTDQTVVIGETPAISVFSPTTARPNDLVSLFGRNLDRDAAGHPWNGDVPFVAAFVGRTATGSRVSVPVTFRSATELSVRVPAFAADGTIILAAKRSDGSAGETISETSESLIIIRPDATPVEPPTSNAPAPASTNRATVTVQSTSLNAITPGSYHVATANQNALAVLDLNHNFFFDLVDPSGSRRNVPFMALPERTSEFDFTTEPGSGYFAGADTMLWFQIGDTTPGVPGGEVFVTVQLDVDLDGGTARPIAMIAGLATPDGIVLYTDASGFGSTSIQVERPVIGGPGAIRGHVEAVPLFLQNIFLPSQPGVCGDPDFFCPDLGPSVEQRLWANGIVIDFDLSLFNDAA
jgi:hypothetical protein